MKKLTVLLLLISYFCSASDLTISKPILYVEGKTIYSVFNLKWSNAWKNDKNHDAIWVFSKLRQKTGEAKHISVAPDGHQVINTFKGQGSNLKVEVAKDRVGLFVFPSEDYRGDIEVTLRIQLNVADFAGVNVRNSSLDIFGVEMVMIPSGSFYLGSPNQNARQLGTFYDPNDSSNGLIKVTSENDEFEVSSSGNLYYNAREYEGDQKGKIPASYPKGVDSFYTMKYELLEGQYVHFLNSLPQPEHRTIHEEKNYSGSIELNEGTFSTDHPNRPCPFVSWNDATAYADWAGLRPMTEFEYTKAARGTEVPKGIDYPWGVDAKEHIQRLPDEAGNLVMLNGWDESALSDETKKYFGASYYWVMDLSGSLWERVITVGHENGRNFTGTHGDGMVSEQGNATNENWPKGDEGYGGIGFRGGGFYGYDREYHIFNPFSPIALRPYGGWHGGMRNVAYGTRFVRSVN